MDNIEKLQEKVAKDPASKLFVPLAEEYRKIGRLDEAIEVLRSGLDRQPGYMSARVSLGKIYLEKGLKNEAKEEFEKVIGSIPDNLFARRKLADLYREVGETQKAIDEYKTVLKLNPFDDEAHAYLLELEGSIKKKKSAPPAAQEPSGFSQGFEETTKMSAFPPTESETAGAVQHKEAGGGDIQWAMPEEPATALPEEQADASPEEAAAEWTMPEEAFEAAIAEESSGEAVEAFSEEQAGSADVFEEAGTVEAIEVEEVGGHDEAIEAAVEVTEEAEAVEAGGESPFGEAFEAEAQGVEDLAEDLVSADEEVSAIEAAPEGIEVAEEEEISLTPKDADAFISEGNYRGAMKIYEKLLSADPDNRLILQRADELRSLLKLMGTEKDIESRLDSFLEGIRKRRDEFFAGS